ncbi:hypothetical protein EHS25_005318 [Saitozyma podzolica]|uniref:Carboxymuconolactone decarboxylase-like domain-containing protein n=1 Tax=Saitozyma podzolica TaxID=1890683 RepID=A0A427XZ32_9TREE|nr:hypothetical protein EHS25_005318 [Saitozyma podzolica]
MNSQQRDEAFQQLYDRGMGNRRKVMGDAYVDKALAGGVSEFSRPAQEYVTRNAWDGIWGREGLEFKHRSLVVISICAALGHTKELAGHVRGALNNGLTEIEIREAMLHIMGYCGFPVGLEAFRTCEPVIEAWKAERKA